MVWNGKDTIYAIDLDGKAIVQVRKGAIAGKIMIPELSPVAIAVDKSGALWVLDKKKMRVVKLDDAGNILSSFGSRGSAVGQMDEPTDMAISSTGVIYVADRGNNWVQAFNREGVFLYVIRNGVAAKLADPHAITVDPQDNLYVLDKSRSTIVTYSAKGEPLKEFDRVQEGPSAILKPTALMATLEELFVLDSNQVKVFSHSGQYLRSFGAEGSDAGDLRGVERVLHRI